MSKFKHMYQPHSSYGGYSYEATTDGKVVHIKVMSPLSNSFRIAKRISKESWDAFVEEYDLNGGNRTNPALISGLAHADENSRYYAYCN